MSKFKAGDYIKINSLVLHGSKKYTYSNLKEKIFIIIKDTNYITYDITFNVICEDVQKTIYFFSDKEVRKPTKQEMILAKLRDQLP